MTATLWQSCQEEGGTHARTSAGRMWGPLPCVGTELTGFTLEFAWFVGSLWLGSKREVGDHLGP